MRIRLFITIGKHLGIFTGVFALSAASSGGDVIVPNPNNTATATYSVVVSGNDNTASGDHSGVLAGANNLASGPQSVILGGQTNTATSWKSIVVGGVNNHATGNYSFIGSGLYNEARQYGSTILNGIYNTVDATHCSILAGMNHLIDGESISKSTIISGYEQTILSSNSAIISGHNNVLHGMNSAASGLWVTLEDNMSFAHARDITCAGIGVTVFTDHDPNRVRPASTTLPESDIMYGIFENGYKFYTRSDLSVGASLPGGATAWYAISDRDSKEKFENVDTVEVLKKVSRMPITTWNYKHDDKEVRYMGVMAQDLHEAFGLGMDDKTINTLVADGVAMAAIQGLNQLVEEKDREISALKEEIAKIGALEARLEKLTEIVKDQAGKD